MARHSFWFLLIAALLWAALLSACDGGAPAVREINVDASEFKFEPATITAQVGQPVRVTVTNTGSLEHTFTVTELGVEEPLPVGQTIMVEFTPAQSGTLELVCTVPGHMEAGMVGTVTVNP